MCAPPTSAGHSPGAFANNVTRFLESKQVPYQLYLYDYAGGVQSAVEVANAIGLPPEQVFKTLVVLAAEGSQKPMLVMVPGPASLDLKSLAREVGIKKVKMALHQQAEALTGLETGGISALALLNHGFHIYLDARAQHYTTIVVSAGQRGANVGLALADFVRLVRPRFVTLA